MEFLKIRSLRDYVGVCEQKTETKSHNLKIKEVSFD